MASRADPSRQIPDVPGDRSEPAPEIGGVCFWARQVRRDSPNRRPRQHWTGARAREATSLGYQPSSDCGVDGVIDPATRC